MTALLLLAIFIKKQQSLYIYIYIYTSFSLGHINSIYYQF